jgi:hypothetical protein
MFMRNFFFATARKAAGSTPNEVTEYNSMYLSLSELIFFLSYTLIKYWNSVALSPQVNYTDWTTVKCRRNLVPTFVDRGVLGGQRGGSPTVVNLSFLDRRSSTELHFIV